MDDFADAGCEHFYAWSSPAGTRHGIGVCIYCHQPDGAELEKMARALESLGEALDRARHAAQHLNLLLVHASQAERDRLLAKLDGVKLVESYISDEMRLLHEQRS